MGFSDCWAVDGAAGEELSVESGTGGHVRVLLEAGYTGLVHAWYAGMWYWEVFELISLLTAAGLYIGYFQFKKYRAKMAATLSGRREGLER
ncbi:MAG: hypothetical protein LUE16_09930 [Lachnospiraceae bacterium]|nr:hypothetical protein [Lachnospiraceae bacterium]